MRIPTWVDWLGRVISRRAHMHWQEIRSPTYKLHLPCSMQPTCDCVHLTQWLEVLRSPNTEDCCLVRLGAYLSSLSLTSVHTALRWGFGGYGIRRHGSSQILCKTLLPSKALTQIETIAVHRKNQVSGFFLGVQALSVHIRGEEWFKSSPLKHESPARLGFCADFKVNLH